MHTRIGRRSSVGRLFSTAALLVALPWFEAQAGTGAPEPEWNVVQLHQDLVISADAPYDWLRIIEEVTGRTYRDEDLRPSYHEEPQFEQRVPDDLAPLELRIDGDLVIEEGVLLHVPGGLRVVSDRLLIDEDGELEVAGSVVMSGRVFYSRGHISTTGGQGGAIGVRGQDGLDNDLQKTVTTTTYGADGQDGPDGENGSNGGNASCKSGAHHGAGTGTAGGSGGSGGTGGNSGSLVLEYVEYYGGTFTSTGGDGGDAGDGGRGGNGGKGICCSWEYYPGKDGGNGGTGGRGGNGGKGGNITIKYCKNYSHGKEYVFNAGGVGGNAGVGGTRGAGGSMPDCIWGGSTGNSGQTGYNGSVGSNGSPGSFSRLYDPSLCPSQPVVDELDQTAVY